MRLLTAGLIALLLLSAAAPSATQAATPSRLPSFSSCTDLVDFARRNLSRPAVPPRVFPPAEAGVAPRAPLAQPDPSQPQPMPGIAISTPTAAPEASPGEDYSTTNVQEVGIDEPDLVKTDGRRLYVVAGTELRIYDVTTDAPALLSVLNLEGAGGEILVRGDRILLVGPAPAAQSAPTSVPPPTGPAPAVVPPTEVTSQTRFVEIDVRDPAAPRIARTMTAPGRYVTARLTGGTARVVLSSPAALPDEPVADTPPGVSAFVPRTVLRSRITKRTFRRQLVPCANVRHPRAYAGNDLLTVLSVDLDRGLFDVDRDAVMAGAQVVYASATGLYVASQKAARIRAGDVPEGMRTEIHRFDTTAAGQTTYASSGSVAGFVLNQYALSEHDGALRVATTEEPQWVGPDAAARPSESAVSVLEERGTRLEQVGRVGGLGRGERIYAVRFIGEAGYLVTFRQVDPLYTLDLRDHTAPRVVGELKITGYSAYLHPIGDDLLLGVGQEATETGMRLGAQVSVFDVSNPADPTRLHQQLLGAGGSSQAEVDPHAFLWWPARKLALLPYETWRAAGGGFDRGMLGLRAGRAEGLSEVGRIVHGPEWDQAAVARSVVVRDRVLTVSDLGVAVHRLDGLAPAGFLPFTS